MVGFDFMLGQGDQVAALGGVAVRIGIVEEFGIGFPGAEQNSAQIELEQGLDLAADFFPG